jgi:hypothetical protein
MDWDEDDVRDYVGRGHGDPGPEFYKKSNGDDEENRRRAAIAKLPDWMQKIEKETTK